jgi:hypothetical protein
MIAFLALLAAGLLDAGDARRTTARVNEVVNRLGLRRVEETGLRARLLWVHDTWRDGLLDHWIHQLVIERLAMNDRVVYTLLRDPWIHRIEIHVEEDGLPYEEAIRYVTAGSLDPSRSIEEQFRLGERHGPREEERGDAPGTGTTIPAPAARHRQETVPSCRYASTPVP